MKLHIAERQEITFVFWSAVIEADDGWPGQHLLTHKMYHFCSAL
jgi:hypothetical protein